MGLHRDAPSLLPGRLAGCLLGWLAGLRRLLWAAAVSLAASSCLAQQPAPPPTQPIADPSPPSATSPRTLFRVGLTDSKDLARPRVLHSVAPQLSREAFKGGFEGVVLVKCVVTTEGTLENCRIIKGLPNMDDAVLAVMPSWRYSPATYKGTPVNLDLVIPIDVRWKSGAGGR